ncbi:hypothetical protein [Sulfurimonas sp. HSL3-7]|uniref:hypothetical protein n=1 Tax=Sulfonitrofixus jiaomeiensis TaxID=3131938 RepID=UPI0031F769B3
MSRSTAAFLIALMFHLLIILIFVLLGFYTPAAEKTEPPKEHRIKVSLKERPEVKKDAAVKNKAIPTEQKLMPKGKQLKEITKKPFKKYEPKPPQQPQPPVTKIEPKEPEPKKPKSEPLPPEKPYIPVVKEPVAKTDENVTKEHGKLYSMLSKKVDTPAQKQQTTRSNKRESKLLSDIKEAYGETFGELSPGEQKYILDNQEIMRRITQQVLNRVGRVNIPNDLRVNSTNIVEFYLYPNGDISEIKFVEKSDFYILDDTTKETIEYAYSKYPRPEQKTLIRYKVGYYLRGY